MIFRYKQVGDADLVTLDDEGNAIATAPGSVALIGLKEMSLPHLKAALESFKAELRQMLCDAFSKTPSEFAEWRIFNDTYLFDSSVVKSDSCVGFKSAASRVPKLQYIHQKAIVSALLAVGLIPRIDAHGNPRKNMVRGEGGTPAF